MTSYILRRLGQSIIVVFLVSVFAFALVYMMPGDPVYAAAGDELTEEQYWAEYYRLGLDKPIYERYVNWLVDCAHGEFGMSIKYSTEVGDLIAKRLPITMYLGIISLIISTVVGVVLGIASATTRHPWVDYVITVLANLGAAVPGFWLGVVGVYVFAVKLHWLPTSGFHFPWSSESTVIDSLKETILPVITLSVATIATTTRQMRSSMLEVVRLDFVRAVRAKGVKEHGVIYGHALQNALIPIVTLVGLHFRQLVAGAVSTEKIFNITGMGNLLVTAVFARDSCVTQACILLIAIVVTVANLLVDISYGLIDPRIRVQ